MYICGVNPDSSDTLSAHSAFPAEGERIEHLCRIVILAARQQHEVLEQQIGAALNTSCSHGDVYEALTQLYLFCGFPAALEGLLCLHNVVQTMPDIAPMRPEAYDPAGFAARGEELCRRIYTSAYDKIRERLAAAAPDLDQWMIVEGYGKTLARPQLDIGIRELLIVAVLCVGSWERQLFSHLRGALNVGVDAASCRAVIDLAGAEDAEARRRHHEILDRILRRST